MELKIKRGLSKTNIIDSSGNTVFIIKNKSIFSIEKTIFFTDGSRAYSVRRDPKPLDRRDKYIFTDYASKNEFYAWADIAAYQNHKSIPLYKYFFFSPLEIYIEAESFFGELCINRSGISKFDIVINGRKRGNITSKRIICDDIDDAGLLAVLYVFSLYIIHSEEICRIADAT